MRPDVIHPFLFREPVSAGLHLFWCLWSVYTAALLWRLSGRTAPPMERRLFGLSLVLTYAVSTIYHALPPGSPACFLLLSLDFTAIYLLIAGTNTPTLVILLRGRLRLVLLAVMWGLAAGILSRWTLPRLPSYEVTVSLYVALGTVGYLPIRAMTRVVGMCMAWGVLNGLLYVGGAVCDAVLADPLARCYRPARTAAPAHDGRNFRPRLLCPSLCPPPEPLTTRQA